MERATVKMIMGGRIRDCVACTYPRPDRSTQYFWVDDSGRFHITHRMKPEEVEREAERARAFNGAEKDKENMDRGL